MSTFNTKVFHSAAGTTQDMHVAIGLRSGEVWTKVKGTTGQAVGLALEDLYELAGLIDDALTEWEERTASGDIYLPEKEASE